MITKSLLSGTIGMIILEKKQTDRKHFWVVNDPKTLMTRRDPHERKGNLNSSSDNQVETTRYYCSLHFPRPPQFGAEN